MHLKDAHDLAASLLQAHQLNDWQFTFDHAKRRFGSCNYSKKQITLSSHLTRLNTLEEVRDTLLHEIAHALTPGTGHGAAWRAKCLELGAKPERCYRAEQVNQPDAPYLLVCDSCGLAVPRYRRSRHIYVCVRCCKTYNGGRPSKTYRLRWQRSP